MVRPWKYLLIKTHFQLHIQLLRDMNCVTQISEGIILYNLQPWWITLVLDLHNSSYHTHPHSVIIIIDKYPSLSSSLPLCIGGCYLLIIAPQMSSENHPTVGKLLVVNIIHSSSTKFILQQEISCNTHVK